MENLSVLFGIALSADDDPSARTMACHALCACTCDNFPCPRLSRNFLVFRDAMKKKKKTTNAISAGGSWIRDPQAQSFLLDLLRRTEAENGWPWAFVMQRLSQDWRLTVR